MTQTLARSPRSPAQFLASVGRKVRSRSQLTGDSVLSALLLYSVLITYVAAVFVAILAIDGVSNESEFESLPWSLTLIAIVIIALTLFPVHSWLQRNIGQLVYGHHDNPYGLFTQLNQHLEAAPSPDAVIPTIASTIADRLKLPYVAIETGLEQKTSTAEVGTRPQFVELVSIPLAYRNERVGTLYAAPRRWDDTLSADDLRLLHDLARQVGITLYIAKLSDALQTSREQLVTAREEERRRIRRDLHDGLGPTLASFRLQLGALQYMLRQDPDKAEGMIDELRNDVRATTAEIRRLVYALRPPMLDEFGLIGAIRNLSVTTDGAMVTVHVPDTLPPLSAAVEVALYRIASEALHNVAQHAQATRCLLQLEMEAERLKLTIMDNGIGLTEHSVMGVGLTSMHERTAELGGQVTITSDPSEGTSITATIPYRTTEL